MTTHTAQRPQDAEAAPSSTPSSFWRPWLQLAAVALVVTLLVVLGLATWPSHHPARTDDPHRPVPTSAAMEQQLGVRFSRVAVVADGGLVTLFYVVVDVEKAQRFQNDVAHPPVLRSESRHLSTKKVSLMKQGHQLRAGQTYYLVYDNPGVLKPGEQVTISRGSLRLAHVPVL